MIKNILISLNPVSNTYEVMRITHVFFDTLDTEMIAQNVPADVIQSMLHRLLQSLEPYTVEGLHYAESRDKNSH